MTGNERTADHATIDRPDVTVAIQPTDPTPTEMVVMPTCRRCDSIAIRTVDDSGHGLCESCYWKREGQYLLFRERMGYDEYGRPAFPAIPNGRPIGIMRYIVPAASWPSDMGLLKCDLRQCGATCVGQIVGEVCSWCLDRERATASRKNWSD